MAAGDRADPTAPTRGTDHDPVLEHTEDLKAIAMQCSYVTAKRAEVIDNFSWKFGKWRRREDKVLTRSHALKQPKAVAQE